VDDKEESGLSPCSLLLSRESGSGWVLQSDDTDRDKIKGSSQGGGQQMGNTTSTNSRKSGGCLTGTDPLNRA